MITALQIWQLLRAQPFKAFRLCMSDWKTYEFTHHNDAWVRLHEVRVGVNFDAEGFPQDVARCPFLDIVRLEDSSPVTA